MSIDRRLLLLTVCFTSSFAALHISSSLPFFVVIRAFVSLLRPPLTMLLKAPGFVPSMNIVGKARVSSSVFRSLSSSSPSLTCPWERRRLAVISASKKGGSEVALTGVVFQPFEEVQNELYLVPTSPNQSLARQRYSDACESAINEHINVEYNVSYVYHSMFAYFDRDNVALKGLAKFFKESSDEERDHAEKLMKYQNKRGGRVKLQSILSTLTEFDHPEKGEALHAMELALSLEKLVNQKLLNLHDVASKANDVQLTDFIESEFLGEQVEAIKKIAEYVSQLRRVGNGHGVWHFDQKLLGEA